MAGDHASPPQDPGGDRITYADFGQRFFVHAVTAERIMAAAQGLAGEEISFGPIGVGPGRLAKVKADGRIGEPGCEPVTSEEVSFRLTIPVSLQLEIGLGVDRHHFDADLVVGLTLTARAASPLRVVVDVDEPSGRDVEVSLHSDALRSTLLQHGVGMDREIARFVARYVRKELDKEHIRAARDIDVAARIDGAWRSAIRNEGRRAGDPS